MLLLLFCGVSLVLQCSNERADILKSLFWFLSGKSISWIGHWGALQFRRFQWPCKCKAFHVETPGTLRASRWKKDVISSFGSGFAIGCKLLGPDPTLPWGDDILKSLFWFLSGKSISWIGHWGALQFRRFQWPCKCKAFHVETPGTLRASRWKKDIIYLVRMFLCFCGFIGDSHCFAQTRRHDTFFVSNRITVRVDAGRPQLELWMHRIGGPSEGPEAIEPLLRPQTAGSSRQKQGISSYLVV